MSVPVFPCLYLPPLEYFACLLKHEEISVETAEHYHRQTYRNRCCIYGPNGRQTLVIPVIHPSREQRNLKEIRIDQTSRWQQIHWRSLTAAYNKSPFFEYFAQEFEPFYHRPRHWLLESDLELMDICLRLLKYKGTLNLTEEYHKDYPEGTDYRAKLLSKKTEHPEDFPRYPQVFEPVHGFIPNLSIVDLLFNRGNDAQAYLKTLRGV